jgi:hypothetical protein
MEENRIVKGGPQGKRNVGRPIKDGLAKGDFNGNGTVHWV